MPSFRESTALHTVELVKHLSLLGAYQTIIYLGIMRAKLSPARLDMLSSLLSCITPYRVAMALSVMHLLGMMSASHVFLHMRKVQGWFSRLYLKLIHHKRCIITRAGPKKKTIFILIDSH